MFYFCQLQGEQYANLEIFAYHPGYFQGSTTYEERRQWMDDWEADAKAEGIYC